MSSESARATTPAIVLDGVSKAYARSAGRGWRSALGMQRGPVGPAVLDVERLEVRQGEALGIIGPNGAGKSTLLKIVAGVVSPTTGSVAVHGRIGAMIELGLGFDHRLSARDNCIVAAVLMGLDPDEAVDRSGEMLDFAGVADRSDDRLGTFSTGMAARLGFSVATHVGADVLVVDEALSVGDQGFQQKCLERIMGMVEDGAALLFVSHEMALVRTVCDRAVLLRGGRPVTDGDPTEVIETYLGRRVPPPDTSSAALTVGSASPRRSVVPTGERLELEFEVEVHRPDALGDLQVAFTLPLLVPGLVVAAARAPVPPRLRQRGNHRVSVRTTPLPLVGGHLRASVSMLSDDGTSLGGGDVDFSMEGPLRFDKPMYAMRPSATLRRRDRGEIAISVEREVVDPVIAVDGLTKRFPGSPMGRAAMGWPWALAPDGPVGLADIDLRVGKAEVLGVVGPNGAGKSTLLSCLAGVTGIDRGSISVVGRVVPVLELGLGFSLELNGWENLRTSLELLVGTERTGEWNMEAIVDFSEVRDAMDRPLKHWSTGMRARLGFAVASSVGPDVLLIDELLTVGDESFRAKALDRLGELVQGGTAVVLVSHDADLVQQVCHRAIRLEEGRIVDRGSATEVVERGGGLGWSGSPTLGSGDVAVRGLTIARSRVLSGSSVDLFAEVEVAAPAPAVELELSMCDPAGHSSVEPLTTKMLEIFTAATAAVSEQGDLLRPGHYDITISTGPVQASGSFHFVLSAVDRLDGSRLSEAWAPVTLGAGQRSEDDLPGSLDFEIEVSLVTAPDPNPSEGARGSRR